MANLFGPPDLLPKPPDPNQRRRAGDPTIAPPPPNVSSPVDRPHGAPAPATPAAPTTGAWTMEDYNAGRMEVDPGRGWSGEDWVGFYNRFRPRAEQPAPDPLPAPNPTAPPRAPVPDPVPTAPNPNLPPRGQVPDLLPQPPNPNQPPRGQVPDLLPAPPNPNLPPRGQQPDPVPTAPNPNLPPRGQTPDQPHPLTGGGLQPAPTVQSAFKDALLSRLTQDKPQPITTSSAELNPAITAHRLASQRAMERGRHVAAERAAATGTQGGGFDSALAGLVQNIGGQEAQFEGNLVADANREQAQRRSQEITSALAMAGNFMSEEERNELIREQMGLDASLRREGYGLQRYGMDQDADLRRQGLALQGELGRDDLGLRREGLGLQRYGMDQDADLRRQGLTLQGELGRGDLDVRRHASQGQLDLGGRELGLRDKLGSGQLNLGLLGTLLNNDQFKQQLGANLGMFGAGLNQQALLSLLGGL